MGDISSQVSEARKQGYSDDEIIGFLGSSHPELAPKVKEAQASGYGSEEILTHLAPHRYTPEEVKAHFANYAPANAPDDSAGFWSSLGSSLAGPFNVAANLDTITPGQIWEGITSPYRKIKAGNFGGAAGDILGGVASGKVLGAGEIPPELSTPVKATGRFAKGAVRSGVEAVKERPLIIPALAGAGEFIGGHKGAAIGSGIGAGIVGIPAAIRGGMEAWRNLPAPPEATVPPPPAASPTWKPAPIPKPPAPPPPGPSPTWKAAAVEPPPLPRPTGSPTWKRGTIAPPPEQATTASPSGPTIQGKPVSPEAIEAEIKRVNEIEAARKAVPAPPGQGELAGTRLPDTDAGLHFGTHAAAEKLWGKSPHGQLSKLIEERYGANRTQAFKNIPEGKKPLTKAERQDLLLHLLRVMPEPPK